MLILHLESPNRGQQGDHVYRTRQPCRALGELEGVTVVSGSLLTPAAHALDRRRRRAGAVRRRRRRLPADHRSAAAPAAAHGLRDQRPLPGAAAVEPDGVPGREPDLAQPVVAAGAAGRLPAADRRGARAALRAPERAARGVRQPAVGSARAAGRGRRGSGGQRAHRLGRLARPPRGHQVGDPGAARNAVAPPRGHAGDHGRLVAARSLRVGAAAAVRVHVRRQHRRLPSVRGRPRTSGSARCCRPSSTAAAPT